MRPRALLAVASGIALAIAAYAVLSPSGFAKLKKLDDEERTLSAEVVKARAENGKLTEEVKVLQGNEPSSRAVLEKHAREELGYVRADEVVLTGLAPGIGTASTPTPSTTNNAHVGNPSP